jgi:hypothetical protein
VSFASGFRVLNANSKPYLSFPVNASLSLAQELAAARLEKHRGAGRGGAQSEKLFVQTRARPITAHPPSNDASTRRCRRQEPSWHANGDYQPPIFHGAPPHLEAQTNEETGPLRELVPLSAVLNQ